MQPSKKATCAGLSAHAYHRLSIDPNLAGNAKDISAAGQASVLPRTKVQASLAGAVDEQLGGNVKEILQQWSPRATIGSASPRVDEQEEACDGVYSSY